MTKSSSAPLVSIIVAVYNNAVTLQACLDSVISQTYRDRELIIIDGGSVDGTVDIIQSNEGHIQRWISEPDKGIYDAWNKGLALASGKWITFLGSDDTLAHPDVLAHMVASVDEDQDVEFLSGKANMLDSEGKLKRVKGAPWQWSRFRHFMGVIVHPAALHSSKLFDRLGDFDPSYQIAGDYEFLLRAGPHLSTRFIPEIVVDMGGSGVSSKFALEACYEAYRAQCSSPYVSIGEARINLLLIIIKYYAGLAKYKAREILSRVSRQDNVHE